MMALVGPASVVLGTEKSREEPSRHEIFYHVFVRSFRDSNGDRIGDLGGLKAGLGYIKQLGATTILLTPIQPSPFYHNYFATDFQHVAPEYGGDKAYFAFLRAAHACGLKVYIDLEFQYLAGGHPWLKSAWHHPNSPYRNWIPWDKNNPDTPAASPFGLHVGAADGQKYVITYAHLNNPATRSYFRRYLLHWADPHDDGSGRDGVDGYRIDHMMDDLDNMHIETNLFADFWTPLIAAVKARRPGFRFVAEQYDWGYGTDFLTRGHADMVFAFPLRTALTHLDKAEIVKAITATEAATPAGKNQVTFLENHDTDRYMSVVGNDIAKAKAGAAILMTLRGEPSIYYGQELGMRGKRGPDEPSDAPDIPRREAFRWHEDLEARGSAIWYKSLARTWTPRYNRSDDGVSVDGEMTQPDSLLNLYRALIRLRRERPELSEGAQSLVCPDASPILCVLRTEGAHQTLLLVNLSTTPASPELSAIAAGAALHPVIGQGDATQILAPYEVRILGTK